MNERHTCTTYIVKSKTGSEEMQVIHFDQDVRVCGIFSNPNIFGTPLIMTFSLFNVALEVWAISLFSTLLEPSCIPFFYCESFICLSFFLLSFLA
jgi:hypothetical protein